VPELSPEKDNLPDVSQQPSVAWLIVMTAYTRLTFATLVLNSVRWSIFIQ
jgi:hypothetical protein